MKPKPESSAAMRRCFTYLINLVLRAPKPLTYDLRMNSTTPEQLLAFAVEYSKWYDGVMLVRAAYRALQTEEAKKEEKNDNNHSQG